MAVLAQLGRPEYGVRKIDLSAFLLHLAISVHERRDDLVKGNPVFGKSRLSCYRGHGGALRLEKEVEGSEHSEDVLLLTDQFTGHLIGSCFCESDPECIQFSSEISKDISTMEPSTGCLQKDRSLVPVQIPLPADAFLVFGLFLWSKPFRAPAMLVDREMF